VINDTNQGETYIVQSGVGPPGPSHRDPKHQRAYELRHFEQLPGTALQPPRTMKLGLEVYDDPDLAGTQIMPAQYATDAQGDLALMLARLTR
jgi:hypothetical protein